MAHSKPNTQQIIIIIDNELKLSGPLHDDPTFYIKCSNRWLIFNIFYLNSIYILSKNTNIISNFIQINQLNNRYYYF